LDQPEDIKLVQGLIYEHLEKTDSARAKDILDRWDHFRPLFVKVMPKVEPVPVPPEDEPAVEGQPAPGEKVAPVA
jgi:glutamate synthase (NADPH/NADH) large chain/glutamate synthase (ferredoxin)